MSVRSGDVVSAAIALTSIVAAVAYGMSPQSASAQQSMALAGMPNRELAYIPGPGAAP